MPKPCQHDPDNYVELSRPELAEPRTTPGAVANLPAQVVGKKLYLCPICDRGVWR